MVFRFYLERRNFLTTSSCDWDLIERSMLWCMYFLVTYTSKGNKVRWVLIGSLAFVVAILSAVMFNLASTGRSNWDILEL